MSIKSYLTTETAEKYQSQFSGEVTVVRQPKLLTAGKSQYKILAGGLLQSGSIIKQLWQNPLKTLHRTPLRKGDAKRLSREKSKESIAGGFLGKQDDRPPQNILLLGLGGGTVVKMLQKKFPDTHITAVEIDPVMITIAKKYFKIKPSSKLKIVQADAFKFVTTNNLQPNSYNLILVDLFAGDSQPAQLHTHQFHKDLKKILSQYGQIIFNCLFFDHHKINTEKFIEKIENEYEEIKLIRSLSNLFVIAKLKT